MKKSVKDRFLDKISIEPNSGCWLWTAGADEHGYGQMNADAEGFPRAAHRIAWILFRGPIPDGICVCHQHDDPWCVNPDHLFLGTQKDNMDDKMRKGRHSNQKKTHCAKGHPFSGENLCAFGPKHGKRYCRTCNREKSRLKRLEKAALRISGVATAKL